MQIKIFKHIILVPLMSLLAGVEAKAISYYDAAWFLGSDRTVSYCIQRDEKFAASHAEIENTITWAFETWIGYIKAKSFENRPSELKLAQHFKMVDDCISADLQFIFGIQNDEIQNYKEQDFVHPASFARMTELDLRTGVTKGLIWVANDHEFVDLKTNKKVFSWTERPKLKAILLHELGHVFGVGHIEGTIMRPQILDLLKAKVADIHQLTHIDGIRELLSSNKTDWLTGKQYQELGTMNAGEFLNLTGRAPQGAIQGRWLPEQKKITLQDHLGQFIFDVKIIHEFEKKLDDETPLFYSVAMDRDGQMQSANLSRQTQIQFGIIKTASGLNLKIIFEKNTGDRHMAISYQPADAYNGEFKKLFVQPCEWIQIPWDTCLPVYPMDEG